MHSPLGQKAPTSEGALEWREGGPAIGCPPLSLATLDPATVYHGKVDLATLEPATVDLATIDLATIYLATIDLTTCARVCARARALPVPVPVPGLPAVPVPVPGVRRERFLCGSRMEILDPSRFIQIHSRSIPDPFQIHPKPDP